ncbi:ATP-grasp domain-containing protein [Undibacterium sp. TJN25]|uniref:ATP-grasp domain-containing protein n=1 Tax=Undibacterium sp. TJN25 TaxID=3413056 RepID=UPI003BF20CAB
MDVRNVLVFPAGTEIGLEIYHALKFCKEVKVFGAGQAVSNHAEFAYPQYHVIPNIHEADWLPRLVDLCRELSIDYIFPAYDDIVLALSREQQHIPAAIISSPLQTCEITRSKMDTYARLADIVRVPHVYPHADLVARYPVFVKPDRGQGSFGAKKIHGRIELDAALSEVPGSIICEYLPGEEYTVDCFSDRERGLLFAGARSRRRTRNGISVNTHTENIDEASMLAEKIGARLGLRGAWFFQLKRAESGDLVLLEVAPRIAGAMATHRVMGVNFPLLSIFEHERLPLSVLLNPGEIELDRALSNRYRHQISFDTAYIDLDDTLLLRDKVNVSLVKLIYQCRNQGKCVKLITRHAGDLERTLDIHRLSGMFDEVIHLRQREKKSAYIPERTAIFIDDSFAERRDVVEVCGIPTFDCSMIELLSDAMEAMQG